MQTHVAENGMKGRCAVVVLAVLALAVSSCGGAAHGTVDTTASHPAKAPMTAAERRFIAEADTACEKLDLVLHLVRPKNSSLPELAKVVPGYAELEQRSVAKLKKLKVPVAMSASWREILVLREQLARELKQYGHAAASEDKAAAASLAKSKAKAHVQLNTVGKAAGFDQCSRVG